MHEYLETDILEIKQKQDDTRKFGKYFYRMYKQEENERFLKTSNRMKDCLTYWNWDLYQENKLMDLKKVSRCKNRFCPNCNKLTISKAINDFAPIFQELIKQEYLPYMITLTVPNCEGKDLKLTIEKMQIAFKKFWEWLYKMDRKGYQKRITNFVGGVRAIEVTYNEKTGLYHPHFHFICFSHHVSGEHLRKIYPGYYQRKSNSYRNLSDMDFEIMKLWTLAWNNKTIKDINKMDNEWWNQEEEKPNYLMCDFTELEMPGGIYEVFKYCYKSSEIKTLEQFRNIFKALDGKRVRQTYGKLYGLDLDNENVDFKEDKSDVIENYLLVNREESPQNIATQNILELTTVYNNYRKISRFNYDMSLKPMEAE